MTDYFGYRPDEPKDFRAHATIIGSPAVPRAVLRKLINAYLNWSGYWVAKRADMQAAWGPFANWENEIHDAAAYPMANWFWLPESEHFDERWLAVILRGSPIFPDEIAWHSMPASWRSQVIIDKMLDANFGLLWVMLPAEIAFLHNYILWSLYQTKVADGLFEIANFHFTGEPD